MRLSRPLLYRLISTLRAFQKKGLWAGSAELGRTVLRIFYQRGEYIIIAHTLSGQIPPPAPKPGLVVRQVNTRDEIANLSSIAEPVDMARFYKMFDHGSIAFIAFQNGQSVGCCWISQEVDRRVNRVQFPLGPGDACVHDLFVSPAHRGQGLGKSLILHRLRFLREHGYRRALGVVLKDNVPALKINKKAEYEHIGEMSHTRILFWDSFYYNMFDA